MDCFNLYYLHSIIRALIMMGIQLIRCRKPVKVCLTVRLLLFHLKIDVSDNGMNAHIIIPKPPCCDMDMEGITFKSMEVR